MEKVEIRTREVASLHLATIPFGKYIIEENLTPKGKVYYKLLSADRKQQWADQPTLGEAVKFLENPQ